MANNSTSFTSFADAISSHAVCFTWEPIFDPNDMSRPDSVHSTWTFLAVVSGIASLPTAVLNALIVWVVFDDEDLRSSAFNILLASLALTDFLVGLLVEPMFCAWLACLLNGCHSPCQFTVYVALMITCCGTTAVTLAFACVERYLAIEHPNFYRSKITGKKVMIGTGIFGTATLVYLLYGSALVNQIGHAPVKVPFATVILVSTLVILYCSTKVHLTAYRQGRTISQQQESVQQPDEQQQQEQRRREFKQAFMVTIVIALTIFFYTPLIVVTAIEAVQGKDVTSDFKYLAGPISGLFLYLQSLINPIVMSLRLSYIRQGIKNKLACLAGN